MDEARLSTPILVVHYALLGLTLLAAMGGVYYLFRASTDKHFPVRVTSRTMRLEVRQVPGKRSPSKLFPALFLVTTANLLRSDNNQTERFIQEEGIGSDGLATLSFLDRFEVGRSLPAFVFRNQIFTNPQRPWRQGIGLLGFAWVLWCVAAMTKTFATGQGSVGWYVAGLALPLVGLAAFGVWNETVGSRDSALTRATVEGRVVDAAPEAILRDLAGLGVSTGDDVRKLLGETKIRYCEYVWQGKTYRSTSNYCYPADDQTCPGRVNPENPRDVKWRDEP